MNKNEIYESILLLGCGVALSQESLDNLMIIIEDLKFDSDMINNIKNRELKSKLYEHFGLCPSEPVEYLRFIVHKLTGESLLIKNDDLINKIKSSSGIRNKLFQSVLDDLYKKAPDDLASIFFRFKPIFLALKSISDDKGFFNRLRKKADKIHKPMPEDFLNSVTAHIKNGNLDIDRLSKKLDGAVIFRKIRLAYALNFRLNCPESIVYKVRNGKGWATEFGWDGDYKTTSTALSMVKESISDSIRHNVEGKNIYIPSCIHYALPATEKQFIGNLPNGSYASSVKSLVFGIHWYNNDDRRVDLDLSLLSSEGKIGWDGSYRQGCDILFSGDITDPGKNGASELFYIKKGMAGCNIVMVNDYNHIENSPVPCKFFVADEKPKKLKNNYMVDPNNIVLKSDLKIEKKQNILGLLANVDGENRIYFNNTSVGKSISSSFDENTKNSQRYLFDSVINSIGLSEILTLAGANVTTEKSNCDMDLSPELLNKSTILNLLV